MLIRETLGNVIVSNDVIAALAGHAATGCFGVKGMVTKSVTDGIVRLLKRDHMSKGVFISEQKDQSIDIELHIAVDHGINIPALCKSIVGEVKYHTERLTGVHIGKIDVCVDSIRVN